MGFNKAHKMAQRLHRERRQPEYRKKLGYLEKKQDYKKRALDHHMKAERLKKLKNKAQERNPNEFHFHMLNSRIVDGVHQEALKPMDPSLREKLVRKEELLRRYNERLIQNRKARRHPKGDPRGEDLGEDLKTLAKKRKHIVFNN